MTFKAVTHCVRGHLYTEENTIRQKDGKRRCRICHSINAKEWYEKKGRDRLRETGYIRRGKKIQERLDNYTLPPLNPPAYDSGFGHWLSGFTDGEGCFSYHKNSNGYVPQFAIAIRDDDMAVLEAIKDTLGVGIIDIHYRRKEREYPLARYTVRSILDIYNVLLPQFDTFPLRAKKSRDYALWREMVMLRMAVPLRAKRSEANQIEIANIAKQLSEIKRHA